MPSASASPSAECHDAGPSQNVQDIGPRPLTQRWWHERFMWLVLGGPALVVVASFATLALALIYPDPVMSVKPQPPSLALENDGDAAARAAQQPAMRARNHAATGGLPDGAR